MIASVAPRTDFPESRCVGHREVKPNTTKELGELDDVVTADLVLDNGASAPRDWHNRNHRLG